MNISNIDLNLLVVFKAIFEKRNISKVAIDLGLSQPTISHALNRLRETFDDELFVRSGRVMIPTNKASDLGPFICEQLLLLEQGLFSNNEWNPLSSKKRFVLSGTAYDASVWLPSLVSEFQVIAPSVKIDFKGIVYETFLEKMNLGEVDLSFAANLDTMKNFSIHTLSKRGFSLIAKKNSRRFVKNLSLEQYLKAEHIVYTPTEKPGSPIDTMLKTMGKKRNIVITTSYLNSIPYLVCEKDCLALVPDFFAEKVRQYFPIKLINIPFDIPSFTHQMIWHRSLDNSAEHEWLRNTIIENYKRI